METMRSSWKRIGPVPESPEMVAMRQAMEQERAALEQRKAELMSRRGLRFEWNSFRGTLYLVPTFTVGWSNRPPFPCALGIGLMWLNLELRLMYYAPRNQCLDR